MEHVWELLNRYVRTREFTNTVKFFNILNCKWEKIPYDKITTLIASMPVRCDTVIYAQGYATKY